MIKKLSSKKPSKKPSKKMILKREHHSPYYIRFTIFFMALMIMALVGCLPEVNLDDPELPSEFSQVVPEVRPRSDADPTPPFVELDMQTDPDTEMSDLDGDVDPPDMIPDVTPPDIGPPQLHTQGLYFVGSPQETSSTGAINLDGHLSWWGSSFE